MKYDDAIKIWAQRKLTEASRPFREVCAVEVESNVEGCNTCGHYTVLSVTIRYDREQVLHEGQRAWHWWGKSYTVTPESFEALMAELFAITDEEVA